MNVKQVVSSPLGLRHGYLMVVTLLSEQTSQEEGALGCVFLGVLFA